MNAYDPVAAAKQGAVYLDAVKPAWFREIDLKTLDLAEYNYCILGQCFDGFYNGLRKLVPDSMDKIDTSDQHPFALTFGFNVPTKQQGQGAFERLGLAWRAEIRRRRKNRKR